MPRVEFDRQPHLAGELLHLRPLRPDDWDALFAVASDPLIWEVHPARDRYTEPVFRQFFREALESGGALVAIDEATGLIIGSSRYNWFGPERDELEIGWSFLARAYWGGVYNREMKRLTLEYAFQFVDRVIFVVGVDNIRSRKAMLNIGGVLTDRRVTQEVSGVVSESVDLRDHEGGLLPSLICRRKADLLALRSFSGGGKVGHYLGGAAIVAGSQCSSALPLTKRHVSNHVV